MTLHIAQLAKAGQRSERVQKRNYVYDSTDTILCQTLFV